MFVGCQCHLPSGTLLLAGKKPGPVPRVVCIICELQENRDGAENRLGVVDGRDQSVDRAPQPSCQYNDNTTRHVHFSLKSIYEILDDEHQPLVRLQ